MKITTPISLGIFHVWAQDAEAAGGFFALPMTRHTPSQALARRQTDVSLPAADYGSGGVDIGTPKQRVQLAVDIGQSSTVVMGKCKAPYSGRTSDCEKTGEYNASLSTTGMFVADDGWEEKYEDSERELEALSWARIKFYADDLTIAGQGTLKNASFGAYQSAEAYQHGFLGLGFSGTPARGVLDDLAEEGSIGTRSFGITLGGGGDDDAGSLVLGGVDTKKFSGMLTKVPVVDAPPGAETYELERYWIPVDGARLDDGSGGRKTVGGFEVYVESNSPFTYLPSDMVVTVAEAFGVRNWTDPYWDVVPCTRADGVNGSLDLDFAGFTASIPYSDLLYPYEGTSPNEGDCSISVRQNHYMRQFPVYLLGAAFLRSVYAVFDQDNMAVWLAKAADCGSEPVAFSQGSNIRGQCEGSSSGGTSGAQGGSANNDGGSAGSRLGVGMAFMLGAALATLVI